ncbi:MAG: ABC transporter ATP-binding protein, partial [Bdellovibrionales bacterium]|nr:ABC transporter ATP-binding protein [Bdellovibrionales bacterium]
MKPHQSVQLTASRLEIGYSNDFILTIDNLALTGNIIALAGHNGAGKSTFMKGLLGLLPMRSGTLSVTDTSQSIHLLPEQHMAFCPESGSVFADITVAEYLALWCRLKRRNARYLYEEGKELIEFLEIGPLLKRKGRELSKGQKQRVQTAAGFFSNPKLFLFDEPFDGLDVQRTHELMQLIREKS